MRISTMNETDAEKAKVTLIKKALRFDPGVILRGEIRDKQFLNHLNSQEKTMKATSQTFQTSSSSQDMKFSSSDQPQIFERALRAQQYLNENPEIKKQRGMTLIELMVVVGIIGVIAAIFAGTADTSNSKATRLYSDMTTIKNASLRAKMDMGAIPSNLTALWTRTNATSANMFGGTNGTTSWSGPYMEQQTVNSSNAVIDSAVSDAVTITINREAAAAATNGGNYSWVYYLRASNVPNAIIRKALKQCAGSEDATATTFLNASCRATLGTGSSEFGTVDLRVDDSY